MSTDPDVMERVCGQDPAELAVVEMGLLEHLTILTRQYREQGGDDALVSRMASTAYRLTLTTANVFDVPCPFEGDVDVEMDGSLALWDCPLCGAEHADDVKQEAADKAGDAQMKATKDGALSG